MRPRAVRAVALAAATALLVSGCADGDELRRYVADNYQVLAQTGDNLEARSDQPVQAVADDLLERYPGRDVYSDPATGTFYRYDDDFVAVRPDPAGGSLISVDDDETGSVRWVPIIGGFYLPGGRFGGPRTRTGGFGETTRGGGPGTGK